MTRRLVLVALWLCAGHLAWLALFWGLLQVPESSLWTLGLSGIIALLLVALGGAIHAGASAAWQVDGFAAGVRAGAGRLHAAIAAGLVFGAIWWTTAELMAWHGEISGQIDAIYIARTGRAGTGWIHAAIFWGAMFVRWSLGLTLAASLLAALVGDGTSAHGRAVTRAALSPRHFLAVTFWLVLLVAIPWQLASWRPARLGVAAEPWLVAAKLTLVALAMSTGWALVLRAGCVGYRSSLQARPPASARETQAAARP